MSDLVTVVLRLVSVVLFIQSLLFLLTLLITLTGVTGEDPDNLSYALASYFATFLTLIGLSFALWRFATRISAIINKAEGIPTPAMNYLMIGSVLTGLFSWANGIPSLLSGIFVFKAYDLVIRDVDMLTRLAIGGILIFFAKSISTKLVPLMQGDKKISGETALLRSGITLLGLYSLSFTLPHLADRLPFLFQAQHSIWEIEDLLMSTFVSLLLLFAVPITNLLGRPIIMEPSRNHAQKTE